jgi:hypothetical protein
MSPNDFPVLVLRFSKSNGAATLRERYVTLLRDTSTVSFGA